MSVPCVSRLPSVFLNRQGAVASCNTCYSYLSLKGPTNITMNKDLNDGLLQGEQMGSAPTMSVTCPPGFAPGAAFVAQDPSTGQQMQVVVPDGITLGQTFQVPFSVPAPVPMAQPYVEQQYTPQPQQYAPQPVAPQLMNVNMMMQPHPQAPIIINNNNNDSNNSTMQMQAPTPQEMYTHEPSTGWQSGLFECCNDIPVCASRPSCSPLKKARPAPIHAQRIALHVIVLPYVV